MSANGADQLGRTIRSVPKEERQPLELRSIHRSDWAAVALYGVKAPIRLPQRKGNLFDNSNGNSVGISDCYLGVLDPVQPPQLHASDCRNRGEDGVAGMEPELSRDGARRRIAIAGKLYC